MTYILTIVLRDETGKARHRQEFRNIDWSTAKMIAGSVHETAEQINPDWTPACTLEAARPVAPGEPVIWSYIPKPVSTSGLFEAVSIQPGLVQGELYKS